MEQSVKKCTKCLKSKPLEQFVKNKKGGLGRHSICKECQKQYRKDNKEAISARQRLWYLNNKEAVLNRDSNWRENNKDHILKRRKKYYESHREDAITRARKRRAVKLSAFVEDVKLLIVCERDNWVCGICYSPVNPNLVHPDPWSKSLDHIVPLSKGGLHSYNNVQLAHLVCNFRKHDKMPDRGLDSDD